ncbi:MAG TPA: TlpA disulfide reductase family protein [Candidatus Limnocylindria bacterium]|nr:TlpA disulfide reductase family protein [Candidatus Limnocylindria bacterium]
MFDQTYEHHAGSRTRSRYGPLAWPLAAGLVLALGCPAGPSGAAGVDSERIRAAAKHHELRTLDGRTLSLESLRGEVVVVNFWASWCAPCRRELPDLNLLHAEIAPKGGRVLAVSIDHEARNVRRFVDKHRLTLPIYHDGPDGLVKALDLQHIPFTLILDRNGEVAFTSAGADAAALQALGDAARRLVAVRKPLASQVTVEESP